MVWLQVRNPKIRDHEFLGRHLRNEDGGLDVIHLLKITLIY